MRTRDLDLCKLNSATKYPSIPTYHALGERGKLLCETVDFEGERIIATEKVDGTNSRIVLMPDGCYLIGSREELLHAKGDLIHNPALGIVDALRTTADHIDTVCERSSDTVLTIYLETYGGKTTAAAKQYTSDRSFGFRLFDVSRVDMSQLDDRLEAIASWRENGGQRFLSESDLIAFSERAKVELTPRIAEIDFLPTEIEATYEWLRSQIPSTHVALDSNAGGRPEGLVVRTSDRKRIAKIRFEDYQRHEKRRNK